MTPTYDDPTCRPCMEEFFIMREEDRINWCIAHQEMWMQWQHDKQPPVIRRDMPRCPECNHHPRLLRRLFHKDAFECRWGHEVSRLTLMRLEHAVV